MIKKLLISFVIMLNAMFAAATQHSITISGFTFVPASLTIFAGDTVTITASTTHPNVQVDLPTWNANGATPIPGGWSTQTATFSITPMTPDTLYFVCGNHHASGMKGKIIVSSTSGIPDVHAAVRVQIFLNRLRETQKPGSVMT